MHFDFTQSPQTTQSPETSESPTTSLDPAFVVDFQPYDEIDPTCQRWSTWLAVDPLMRGPEPRPDWVVTSQGAVDTELGRSGRPWSAAGGWGCRCPIPSSSTAPSC